MLTPLCMQLACSLLFRDFALVAAEGIALAMLGLVARRTRGISEDVASTSQETHATLVVAHQLLGRNESAPDAPGPKK